MFATWREFYQSDLQSVYALWLVPAFFMPYWSLSRPSSSSGGVEPRATIFLDVFAPVFVVALSTLTSSHGEQRVPAMIRRLALVSAFAALVLTEAFADDNLAALLRAVGEASQPSSPLRAEGTIDSDGLRGKSQDRLVWIERAGSGAGAPPQVFVELGNAKVRLLALGPADLQMAIDGRSSRAQPDQAVDSTSFTAEDVLTFAPDRCAAMRLAELSEDRFSLVCEPKKPPSQYSLMVYKFDRERATMLQVLLYKGTMTNLVKMLRHDDFVKVGAKWRPQRVTMQDFKVRTKDVLSLRWQPDAKLPAETFDPRQLTGTSLLADPPR
jgi:hypothetical protein